MNKWIKYYEDKGHWWAYVDGLWVFEIVKLDPNVKMKGPVKENPHQFLMITTFGTVHYARTFKDAKKRACESLKRDIARIKKGLDEEGA